MPASSQLALAQLQRKTAARAPEELAVLKLAAQEHSELKISLLHEEIKNRDLLDRARHHMQLESQVSNHKSKFPHLKQNTACNGLSDVGVILLLQVRILSQDLKLLTRRSRAKVDMCGDLEQRVKAMRMANHHGHQERPWADRTVDVSFSLACSSMEDSPSRCHTQ